MRAYGARPLLLGGALLGIVVVAGLAALESHRTFVARKASAEQTVRDYAKFAAYLYSTRIYLFARERTFMPYAKFNADDPYTRASLPPLSAIPANTDSTEKCGPNWTTYRFRLDLPSRTVQYLGVKPLPSVDRIIRDSIPALVNSPWVKLSGFGYLFVDPPGAPREAISYLRTLDSAKNVIAVYGYRSCYGVRDTTDYSTVHRIVKVLPPMIPGYGDSASDAPSAWCKCTPKKSRGKNAAAVEKMAGPWPNGMPADSLLYLKITDFNDRVLYQVPASGKSSDLYGVSPIGFIGGVWVWVSLRPDVAKFLVAGGIPESHVPASLVLFAGAIVLAIAGFA